jgi:hypothetical protein
MLTFQENMQEYRRQLEKGAIQKAYRGLMEYMMSLRKTLVENYPDYSAPGSLYFGYMDMTYFALVPKAFKERNLKIAIVFLHEAFRFEAWLAGVNKQVQTKYWEIFKRSGWNLYPIVPSTKGADSIVEHILLEKPDFGDLDALTGRIESGTLKFAADIEDFLAREENAATV